MPTDPAPDPEDLQGRRGELVHAVTCRIHSGVPLSKWDWRAICLLGLVLELPYGGDDLDGDDEEAVAGAG